MRGAGLRNMPLYMHVLAAVAREPKSARLVADELGVRLPNSIQNILRLMRGRLVHVASYAPATKGLPIGQFLLGDRPDAPCLPAVAKRDAGVKRQCGAELAAFIAMLVAMQGEPQSMKQLEKLSGCVRGTILRAIRIGRELNVLHIAEWDRERHAGAYVPYYAIGVDKPDEPRPKAQPRAAIERRYWHNRRARENQARIGHALAATAHHAGANHGF